jgi:GNAT superfamily N-acetyltransferase
MSELEYRHWELAHTDELVELELRCFPNIDPRHLVSPETVRLQVERFPEGSFMVFDDDRLVGMAAGVFVDYDITEPQHDIEDVAGEAGVGNHDADGDWYYGIDIAVDPEYRGRGISKELYRRRKQLVLDHGKKGFIAGGVLPGYADHKHAMSAQEYVDAVVAGDLTDPTLTAQLAAGFHVAGVIADYVDDPTTDNYASFIVWFNPELDQT